MFICMHCDVLDTLWDVQRSNVRNLFACLIKELNACLFVIFLELKFKRSVDLI